MELYEVIKTRRSIRRYKPDMVPREVINRILEIATWAPSGRNWQQWEFMVISGSKKGELARSYGRVVEFGMPPEGKRSPEQESFLQWARTLGGAPVAIVALTRVHGQPGTRKMNLESVAAAFSYLLLAAANEGLGTCWMTGPLNNEMELRKILDISTDKEIVAITPLGYPDESPEAAPRKSLDEIVTWIGFEE
ncbi:nitroreductase family protein [Moorella sulfitireducens]|uniref:nitroreductase family protein n=1 Tax=Neomoorella sulfitireducens TaxID=2972948 RepID=UPI0021AD0DCA